MSQQNSKVLKIGDSEFSTVNNNKYEIFTVKNTTVSKMQSSRSNEQVVFSKNWRYHWQWSEIQMVRIRQWSENSDFLTLKF